MRVLVANAGSSSLKLSLLAEDDTLLRYHEAEDWDGDANDPAIERFIGSLGEVDAIGHRVVHGGSRFVEATVLDEVTRDEIADLTDLAPQHQPRALSGMAATARLLPGVPAVASFDTQYHATLPDAASTYALPQEWNRRYALRRFGFHGLSHSYSARRTAEVQGADAPLRVVSCHLGSGASVCASHGGRSVDTTMGFTPLEGLVMARRAGSVDPGLLLWLLQRPDLDHTAVRDALERRSGLAGLTGTSGDLREIRQASADGDANAAAAIEVYVHRLRGSVAAMTAAMNGLDALVFTGGVGEHDAVIRQKTVQGLGFLGVDLDEQVNSAARPDARISTFGSRVTAWVLHAREDIEVARNTRSAIRFRDR